MMLSILPGIKAFPNPPSYYMVSSNVERVFQVHCLEDDEILRIPPARLHPPDLVAQ